MPFNTQIRGTRRPGTEKKTTYKMGKDGTIINTQTEKGIGRYCHSGPPNRGERACKLRGRLISYVPLADEA